MIRFLVVAFALLAGVALAPGGSLAQSGNPFSPAVIVNDRTITNFELEQRIRMMELFRTPGDIPKQAMEGLIDDRLRMDAAAAAGIAVTPEAVEAGMAEFAGRANMDVDTFVSGLAAEGVAVESFRDFVTAGVTWREVISARFEPRVRVTDAEIDRAIAQSGRQAGLEAQVAEIILPARDQQELERAQAITAELQANATNIAAFAEAARRYSASPTAVNGGRLPRALPLEELPPPIRSQLVTMAPGQLTSPIRAPQFIAIFQLLSLRETGITEAANIALEFARYYIPGGDTPAARAEAARVVERADTCTDLYGINKGKDPSRLVIETLPAGQVPQGIAIELARLDPGEFSPARVSGANLMLLMLCSRTPSFEEPPDRDRVRLGLINRRLDELGNAYLADLRANAMIRYP